MNTTKLLGDAAGFNSSLGIGVDSAPALRMLRRKLADHAGVCVPESSKYDRSLFSVSALDEVHKVRRDQPSLFVTKLE